MNSPDSWIDRESLHGMARDLTGLHPPPPHSGGKPSATPETGGAGLPVTRLKAEDFRLPEHFLPAPFPPPDETERLKARELLQGIHTKMRDRRLLGNAAGAAEPPQTAPAVPPDIKASSALPPPPAAESPAPDPVAPSSLPLRPAIQIPPRPAPNFEPPLGPLTTRVRALGDWIRRQIGGVESFVLDAKGQPVGERRPPPAIPAAALRLAEAASEALRDFPGEAGGAVSLDLRNERKLCVISAETAEGRFLLCLLLTEALPNRTADRLRRALQGAVKPEE